jgi:hypothetical protein
MDQDPLQLELPFDQPTELEQLLDSMLAELLREIDLEESKDQNPLQ